MRSYPRAPEGWAITRRRTAGPFTTRVSYGHPDGRRIEWSSRRHRKHASRLSRVRPGRDGLLWAPHRASWWIAVLFIVGSTCFLVGPLPAFLNLVGGQADAVVFFVGSLFFTAAAALQWLETVNADRGPSRPPPGGGCACSPGSRAGSTGGAAGCSCWGRCSSTRRPTGRSARRSATRRYNRSSGGRTRRLDLLPGVRVLRLRRGHRGLLRRPPRSLEGSLVSANLIGCVAFGISALGAFVLPSTGDPVAVTVANAGTAIGALAFLVGSVLLLPEGASAGSEPDRDLENEPS